jgi:hypothetical protein
VGVYARVALLSELESKSEQVVERDIIVVLLERPRSFLGFISPSRTHEQGMALPSSITLMAN